LIGIVSYLLISYFYSRIQATKAALLALTMNRLGDMGLSIGFFALFSLFGTMDYSTIFNVTPYLNENAITIISLLLFSGAMAKSAQVPLSSWLPGSMEAPTPVSALLHAATLVTAGVFLLLRSSPVLSYSSDALLIITVIGSITAFVAGTTALVQNDLKRIIAFSTISQLGYMMIAIGLAQWNIALLHTVLHAFFKALLFLSAGVIIHSLNDEQDIRRMGGLIRFMPFTYTVMLIGTIALLGLPWLSGFYSKDLILELAYGNYQFSSIFAFILGTLTAFLTAFYSFRLINLVYLTVPNANKRSYLNIHSESSVVLIPLSLLAVFAIFLGFIASDYVGLGSDFFGNSLFYHPTHLLIIEAEFSLPLYIKLMATILSILGAVFAIFIYHYGHRFLTEYTFPFLISTFLPLELNSTKTGKDLLPLHKVQYKTEEIEGMNNVYFKVAPKNPKVAKLTQTFIIGTYTFLNSKYLIDILYNTYIISGGLKLGFIISKLLDKGIIELMGPFGLTEGSYTASTSLSKLDTGVITTYALYISLGLISILFILFTPLLYITYSTGLNDTIKIETSALGEVGGVLSRVGSFNISLDINSANLIEETTPIFSKDNLKIEPYTWSINNIREDLLMVYNLCFKILLISIFSIYFIFSI
jgi:NADH-ubiquinone oxidoreductase chain 5